MLDSSVKDEVKLRNDIVSVISEYVTLRRTGKNYVGICPFHLEKTPSFTVAPDKQMFYCFGCHASGDVVTFVMKKENKSFFEALKMLADRAGIDLPREDLPPAEAAQVARRRALYDALAKASSLYVKWLKEPRGEVARDYIARRGLSQEAVDTFAIGYAPDSWDEITNVLRRDGLNDDMLVATGLCIPRSKGGGVYDRFRNRVVFPIRDLQGRTIGFGGRSIDGSEPKYLNSPQTEVFNKGKGLFALNIAREAARHDGSLIVVEGYMDAISLHQAGFRNTVASLGTALTQDQARQLVQVSQHVIIAYDADTAGQAATLRGLDVLRQAGANVRVCEIPEGKDPDDYVKSKGPEGFSQLLKDASTVVEYFFRLYRRRFGDSRAGKIRTIESIVPFIAAVENPVELASYITMVAGSTGTPEAAVRDEVARARKRARAGATGDKNVQSRNTKTDVANMEEPAFSGTRAQAEAERSILSLMLSDEECRRKCLGELHDVMFSGTHARLFGLISEAQHGSSFDVSTLVESAAADLKAEIASLAVANVPGEKPERLKIMRDCVITLKKRRLSQLHSQIQSCQDGSEGFARLSGEYQTLLREIKGSDSSRNPS